MDTDHRSFSPDTEEVLHAELENMRILFEDEELFTQAMNLAKKENPPTPNSPLSDTDTESFPEELSTLRPGLQDEMESLRTQLATAQTTIKKLQSHIIQQRVQNNHVISVLKMSLQNSEEQLRSQRTKSDTQLGEVLSHLLFLEGKVKKEQSQIKSALKEKDRIIKNQSEQIQTLTVTNDRLLEAVRETYALKAKNGMAFDPDNDSYDYPDSPVDKTPPGSGKSTPHKSMFESMKNKLKHHRSSLDLTDTNMDIVKGLVKNRQYSSNENLLLLTQKSKRARELRDKKCKSIPFYPDGSLSSYGILEVPDEGDIRMDNFDHSKMFLVNDENQNSLMKGGSNGQMANGHPINGVVDTPSTLLAATSMPILSHTDPNSNHTPTKARPKSISSIEHLTPEECAARNIEPPPKSPGALSNSSFTDSSNPFKNLKTILKRKGSKVKNNKKRSVTMADSPNQEHQEKMKKHFEKYGMS